MPPREPLTSVRRSSVIPIWQFLGVIIATQLLSEACKLGHAPSLCHRAPGKPVFEFMPSAAFDKTRCCSPLVAVENAAALVLEKTSHRPSGLCAPSCSASEKKRATASAPEQKLNAFDYVPCDRPNMAESWSRQRRDGGMEHCHGLTEVTAESHQWHARSQRPRAAIALCVR